MILMAAADVQQFGSQVYSDLVYIWKYVGDWIFRMSPMQLESDVSWKLITSVGLTAWWGIWVSVSCRDRVRLAGRWQPSAHTLLSTLGPGRVLLRTSSSPFPFTWLLFPQCERVHYKWTILTAFTHWTMDDVLFFLSFFLHSSGLLTITPTPSPHHTHLRLCLHIVNTN